MSKFDNLISSAFKQIHIDAMTEVMRGCAVPCQLIFGSTKFVDCANCIFDPIGNKSSNRYQSGGPVAFTVGVCPMCYGVGKIPDQKTENINLCPIYDYKGWIPNITSAVDSPFGYVQTLSVFSTYDSLVQAKEVLINTDTNSEVKARFERNGEPQPCGIGSSSFLATMWKRIEN